MTSRFSNSLRWLPGSMAAGLVLVLWAGAARAWMQRGPAPEDKLFPNLVQDSAHIRQAVAPPARQESNQPTSLAPSWLEEVHLLAQTDAERALSALDALLENEGSELENIGHWLLRHPSEAAHWIESMPEGAVRNVIISGLLAEVSKRDPKSALKMAEALEEPEAREAALSSVLGQWAANAPQDALREIIQRPEFRETPLLGQTFVAAAVEHPNNIAVLLELCPELPKSFVTRAAEALLSREPSALSMWSEKIQDEELRSAVAETIVFHCLRTNPEIAFQWATQLTDANRRAQTLSECLRRTAMHDSTRASTLLDSPWLSAEDHLTLSSPIQIP